MQWHQFKEINWVFNTDNFDCRQQFSLAQQFTMQNKLRPPLLREEIQYQRGEQSWEGLICLGRVSYIAEFQVRHETVCENLGKEEGEREERI